MPTLTPEIDATEQIFAFCVQGTRCDDWGLVIDADDTEADTLAVLADVIEHYCRDQADADARACINRDVAEHANRELLRRVQWMALAHHVLDNTRNPTPEPEA